METTTVPTHEALLNEGSQECGKQWKIGGVVGFILLVVAAIVIAQTTKTHNVAVAATSGSSGSNSSSSTNSTSSVGCTFNFCAQTYSWTQEQFYNLLWEQAVDATPIVLSSWNYSYGDANLLYSWMQISTTPTQNLTFIVGVNQDHLNQKLSTVIYIHPTAQSAQLAYDHGYTHPLAKSGHLVIAMDQRWHGNRVSGVNNLTTATGPYFTALNNSWVNGKMYPYIYDTVLDVVRLIDYLETRPDVDTTRIGISGVSSGGTISWRAAHIDSRISVVNPIIGVEWVRNSTENGFWFSRIWSLRPPFLQAAQEIQGLDPALFTDISNLSLINPEVVAKVWARINPGIMDQFDSPVALPALSPRPMYIMYAQNDTRNGNLNGVLATIEIVKQQYQKDNASANLSLYMRLNQQHGEWPGLPDQIAAFFNSTFLS
eukprot:TRINITY_DN12209_c0_g1_i1.p1 TRINITY_DN12209_c0_g1~~TRINITY_DN12209_c0_g1_i1.p1  ORF type:complete len:439 (-),score=80.96 TRINITY_DN12209_c0_g1_i1:31-1317(-)